MKQISEQTINEIKILLLKRNSHMMIKNTLDNLEDIKVIKDLKDLLRNKGKSSILESDINEIINKNETNDNDKGGLKDE